MVTLNGSEIKKEGYDAIDKANKNLIQSNLAMEKRYSTIDNHYEDS